MVNKYLDIMLAYLACRSHEQISKFCISFARAIYNAQDTTVMWRHCMNA